MNDSWGLLGNPTKEQIEQWQNLPYGEFKSMVKEFNKKHKGKLLKQFEVRIEMEDIVSYPAYKIFYAFDSSHAIEQAQGLEKTNIEWGEPIQNSPRYTYRAFEKRESRSR